MSIQKNTNLRSIIEAQKESERAVTNNQIRKPPAALSIRRGDVSIFLGGSIEMDKAARWQDDITEKLLKVYKNITIFNPRRDDWDSSWKQEVTDKNFYGQVDWEHTAIVGSHIMFLYFQPDTKSPISLLELGLMAAHDPKKTIVCCPEGFWRKGNVDYICKQYKIKQIDKLDDLVGAIASTTGLEKL